MEIKKTINYSHSLSYSWCISCGNDEFGDWADFKINRITQRMRWLEPDNFIMGSPINEEERFENETQHKVKLTRGFLMADTTCTQELWQAVMGKNPSNFKGLQHPVENVSFEDCQEFIEIVNNNNKYMNLRLPTEAEWEYACRAGAKTAFCFGDTIDSQLVNYKKGGLAIFWNETVEVKSLPSNRWGLYQMHGNVREWCADWYGEYSTNDMVDPKGLKTGDSRVLRGGSWFSRARGCRSAARLPRPPSSREDNYGFRFVRTIDL
jgi:formylglycine-generating enzyme required for sulfatase activity